MILRSVTRRKSVEAWVRDIVEGDDVTTAFAALADSGARGVGAILEARARPWPQHRDYRDLDADFSAALTWIAGRNPQPLVDALRDDGAPTEALIWALGCSEHPDATDALIEALGHRDKSVRWAAVVGLGRTHPPRALDPLLSRLRDRSSTVRRSALTTVAGYPDPRIVPALEAYRDRYEPLLLGEERTIADVLERYTDTRSSE